MPILYGAYVLYIKIFLLYPFPFMCIKQCVLKVFKIFSWFEVWYISPFEYKQQDLGFAFIQGRKMSNFKTIKNREKFPFSPISLYKPYNFGKMHNMN